MQPVLGETSTGLPGTEAESRGIRRRRMDSQKPSSYGYGDDRGGSGRSGSKAHAAIAAAEAAAKPKSERPDKAVTPVKLLPAKARKGTTGRRTPSTDPLPDRKDGDPDDDPEGGDSYGKAVAQLFEIACAQLRQRYH